MQHLHTNYNYIARETRVVKYLRNIYKDTWN